MPQPIDTETTVQQRRAFLADVIRPFDLGHKLIRVGEFGDGGYLLPNDMDGIAACFSPGVSLQSSFELDLAKHGIPSFMADGSVDAPVLNVPNAEFIQKHLADETGDGVISLADWMAQCAPETGDLILQMDIEGAEYKVLAPLPVDDLKRFRIIVLELHGIPSILTKERRFHQAQPALSALRENFACAHLHPNNASGTVEVEGVQFPRVIEATFLRRDRVKQSEPVKSLPHPLDVPHRAHIPALTLPVEWVGMS